MDGGGDHPTRLGGMALMALDLACEPALRLTTGLTTENEPALGGFAREKCEDVDVEDVEPEVDVER